jgi:GNAT superfamily N-acetyltransferase
MQLTTATGPLLERILDGTFTIWSEGLSRQAYGRWNGGLMETAWGRARMRRVALMRGDDLLASAKRFDFDAFLHGERIPVIGIGAVFTPLEQRAKGHASALIEHMLADAASRGCRMAALFSEIGVEFYGRLGFEVVDREVLTIQAHTKPGAPAVLVRAAERADLPFLADITAQYASGAAFALDRTAELIAFGVARQRLLAGLGTAHRREVEFFVTEEGHRPVAYVLISRGPAGAFLLECGDRDPSGARIGAMLQVLAARAPAEGPHLLRAWMPDMLRPPQVDVLASAPAAEIMMVRTVGAAATLPTLAPLVFWQTDVF